MPSGLQSGLDAGAATHMNTWLLVTASNRRGEGPAGRDSFGIERTTQRSWTTCGAPPLGGM